MITEIGIVAGEIWHFLDQHGETSLSVLGKGIDRTEDIVLMSLGWLAREGHVILRQARLPDGQAENGYRISLRKNT
ncbi:MAG: winged helix-turn-helix domain-containing protein [Candidatus Omnitrophota bacterium]